MYLTYAVYALCIIFLIWGGKFAGFKNTQFHENSSSLEVMKSLRGFAAIGVILHHISQEDAFQYANYFKGMQKPGELSIFVNAGYLFVSIFFFCSGFGLIKSFDSKPDYLKGFMKKRVLKTLVIPFYVNVIFYAVYYLIAKHQMPLAHWITNFLGLTLMNEYAWYPIVAALLYTAFYVIFKNIKNQKVCFTLMALVIFLMGVFFCFNGHFAWWAGPKNWWLNGMDDAPWWKQQRIIWFFGEWWVNSAPAMLAGMIFARNEEKIRERYKKLYWLKLLGAVVIMLVLAGISGFGQMKFGYWTEWSANGPDILKKFITYCCQIPEAIMITILFYIIMLKYYAINPVSRFFGNLSLETYMMNLIAIESFRFLLYKYSEWGQMPFYKTGNYNLAIYFVCVFAGTIALALVYKLANKMVLKLVKDKPKDVEPTNEAV